MTTSLRTSTRHAALALRWVLAFAIGGFGVVGCGGSGSGGSDSTEAEEQVSRDEPGVYELAPDHYEVVVFAFEGGFEPNEIRVPAGARVDFRVRSVDIPHGFLVDGTGVEIEVGGPEFVEATHTFEEPGEYDFLCYIYCSGGHVNMTGTIIVE